MALTDFGALAPMQKKVWEAESWKAGRDNSFFFASGFMGSGTADSQKPIHYVKDLTKTERGDQCVMNLIPDLVGDGVAGDNLLKGQEEQLTASDQTIRLDQLRNAVRSRGAMSEQRTVIRFRQEARDTLGNWLGQKLDELGFLTASGIAYTLNLDGTNRAVGSQFPSLAFAADVTAPSTNRKFFPGTNTSTATLTAADKMTWNLLISVIAFAKRRRIKPVRYNGKAKYPIVMSTEQGRDLKSDPNYQTNVGRAADRGTKNPLFNGYFAEIDDAILFDHPKVFNTLAAANGSKYGAAGAVDGAQAMLVGAQALGFARIGQPNWTEDADDDYGNRQNVGYGTIVGYKKPVFQSIYDGNANEDFSTVAIFTAASKT
jgi:N4-gp56 family major capsid protein